MQRYRAIVEYDGTHYAGWQRQPESPTIQDAIEQAFFKLTQETMCIYGAGRTDAGVHAKGQVIHFDMTKHMPSFKIRDAINYYLKPQPISLIDVIEVPPTFHARFTALSRSYLYRIVNRYSTLALEQHRVWRVPQPLNINAMKRAAESLRGTHDFSTFRSTDCQAKSPIKTLDHFTIDQNHEDIQFFVKARSFLHHQVRNMVGSLVYVGLNKWTVDDFIQAKDAKDRRRGGPKAPACGLYFLKAHY